MWGCPLIANHAESAECKHNPPSSFLLPLHSLPLSFPLSLSPLVPFPPLPSLLHNPNPQAINVHATWIVSTKSTTRPHTAVFVPSTLGQDLSCSTWVFSFPTHSPLISFPFLVCFSSPLLPCSLSPLSPCNNNHYSTWIVSTRSATILHTHSWILILCLLERKLSCSGLFESSAKLTVNLLCGLGERGLGWVLCERFQLVEMRMDRVKKVKVARAVKERGRKREKRL